MSKDKTLPSNVDDPEQSRRFVDMAREVEADEDPATFERALDRIARHQPAKPKCKRKEPVDTLTNP